jgi:hypothetical protein
VGGQRHAPAALHPRKTRYPLYSRLGGPQGRSGRVRRTSPVTQYLSIDTIFHLLVRTTSAKLSVIVRSPSWSFLLLLSSSSMLSPKSRRLKFHRSRHLTVLKASDILYKLFTYFCLFLRSVNQRNQKISCNKVSNQIIPCQHDKYRKFRLAVCMVLARD